MKHTLASPMLCPPLRHLLCSTELSFHVPALATLPRPGHGGSWSAVLFTVPSKAESAKLTHDLPTVKCAVYLDNGHRYFDNFCHWHLSSRVHHKVLGISMEGTLHAVLGSGVALFQTLGGLWDIGASVSHIARSSRSRCMVPRPAICRSTQRSSIMILASAPEPDDYCRYRLRNPIFLQEHQNASVPHLGWRE
jgi:hypothetical protein